MGVEIRGKRRISEAFALSALKKFQTLHQPSSVGGQGGSLTNKALIPDDKYHMIGAMISELQEYDDSISANRKRKLSEAKEAEEVKDSKHAESKKPKKSKVEKKKSRDAND